MQRTFEVCVIALCVVASSLAVGCGPATNVGNRASGKVTFKGGPIPAGTIYFDPAGGGTGNQGVAKIVDGTYDTASTGMGAPTGSVTVRIEGFEKGPSSGTMGPILCKWETTADFTEGENAKDFEVPETAAATQSAEP